MVFFAFSENVFFVFNSLYIFWIASDSAVEFFIGPRKTDVLFSTRFLFSGISVVMTGSPLAMASIRALDCPSKRVGSTKQSEILRSWGTSVRRPRKEILFFDWYSFIWFFRLSRSLPSPTIKRCVSGYF